MSRSHLTIPGPTGTGSEPAAGVHTITPEAIEATYATIRGHIRRTPVVTLDPTDLGLGVALRSVALNLKLEQLQRGGSFKVRGAFANLLLRQVPANGVVAASGGNHGVAVAYAAYRLGIPARVFVPTVSAQTKIDRIRQLGAELVVIGEQYADALAAAMDWASESGALNVHAFDQRETVLGQASLGLELAEQIEGLDTVLVPVGGGGLIAGIAAYFGGRARIIGIEPHGAPTLSLARAAGRPVDAPAGGIAADALAPRRIGELAFPITQAYVHDVVLVDDAAIRTAARRLWDNLRVIAEPAACVGLAALLTGAYRPQPGENVTIVISGANTTLTALDLPAPDAG